MKRFLYGGMALFLLIGIMPASSLSQAGEGSLTVQAEILSANHGSAPMAFIINPFSSPDWIGEANYEADSFAASVASAGDVNGDGFADVVVGAPYYTNDQLKEGRAYAYYGSDSGLPSSPDWTFESNLAGCELGQKAAPAGDVNGDGFDD